MENRTYIGDGVYISNDGWHVILDTERENGTNQIYLEPELITRLLAYAMNRGMQFEIPKRPDSTAKPGDPK